ncbi:MAG: glycosyltransferase family 9 protein [bacterium]|nr:glycosyltransferase family 9 protein [bacterium]
MHRLLIIRGGAVGDFILTLPALGALRQTFGQAHIEVMGRPSRAILAKHPHYANQITDIEGWDIYRLFSRRAVISERLAAYLGAFDLIIAYLPASAAGFGDRLRQFHSGLVVTWSPEPAVGVHATDHLLRPIRDLDHRPYDPTPQVHLTSEAIATAEQFWRQANLPGSGVLAFHPGSGGTRKLWPIDGWQRVMTWAAQQDIPCIVINGPAEQEQVNQLLRQTHLPAWPCTGQLSLPCLAAIIARCRLLLGHDSGITHLAAAVGTHTLALFGPTDPWSWGPRSPHACILQPQHVEPLNLANLPPATVIHTLEAMWRGTFDFTPSHLGFTIRQPSN